MRAPGKSNGISAFSSALRLMSIKTCFFPSDAPLFTLPNCGQISPSASRCVPSPAGKIPVPKRDRDRNRNLSDVGARCQLGQRVHGWPGGNGWFGNENLRPGVPDLAFLSSAARPQGRFGGSPAETQRINRKELSARVQLGLFPNICSPSGSKGVPVPLDGTVCSSPSRMRERGTPARHRDPRPGFSPLVSGLALLEAPDCTTGELCVCLPGRERLRVGGSGAPWGLRVRDGACRDPPCCRDCRALPSADSRAGERLARLGLCVPPSELLAECLGFPASPPPRLLGRVMPCKSGRKGRQLWTWNLSFKPPAPPQDPSFPLGQDQLQGNHRGRKAADKLGIAGKQKPAGGTRTGLRRNCPKSVPQLGKDLLPPRHLRPAAPLLLLAAPRDASGIKKVGDPVEDTYGLPIWLGAELKLAGEGRGVTQAS